MGHALWERTDPEWAVRRAAAVTPESEHGRACDTLRTDARHRLMTRRAWVGLVLVVLIVGACSPGATASGVPSPPRASGPPFSVAPPLSPSPRVSPDIGALQTPRASASAAACPANPTLADVIALDQDGGPLTAAFRPLYGTYAVEALACYGDSDLRFVAFVAAPEGLGGVETYRIEPSWLVGRGHWLAVDESMEPEGFASGPFLPVFVPPADETAFAGLNAQWVEIHGHFSDPAANRCRVTEGTPPTAPTAPQAIEICTTSFVLTSIQLVPAPSPSP